jgi:hypothetical protein
LSDFVFSCNLWVKFIDATISPLIPRYSFCIGYFELDATAAAARLNVPRLWTFFALPVQTMAARGSIICSTRDYLTPAVRPLTNSNIETTWNRAPVMDQQNPIAMRTAQLMFTWTRHSNLFLPPNSCTSVQKIRAITITLERKY